MAVRRTEEPLVFDSLDHAARKRVALFLGIMVGVAVLSGLSPLPAFGAPGHTWKYDGEARLVVWTPPSEVATAASTYVQFYRDAKAGTDFALAQYSSQFNNTSGSYGLDYNITTKSFSMPVQNGRADALWDGYNLVVFRVSNNVVEKHPVYIPPARTVAVSVANTPTVAVSDMPAVSLDSSISLDASASIGVDRIAGMDAQTLDFLAGLVVLGSGLAVGVSLKGRSL